MQFLKQSTASQIVMIGPFLEDTSGVLPQNGLTIANTDIQINKHSSATFGNKNSGGGTNVANGYYQTTLDATDTNTAGRLLVAINKTSCLPVWHEFTVLPSSSWDAIIGASGAGLPAFVHGYNTGQAPLQPTTAGRTLDVSTGGEAGIDWANVGSPTTSLALTGTTIATTQKVDIETIKTNPVVNAGTVTFPTTATLASTTNITAGTITTATNVTNVNGIANNVITAAAIADGAIDATTFATGAITADAIATDAISAAEIAAGAVAEIQSGLSTLTEAAIRTAVGLSSANIDTQLSAIAAYVDTLEGGVNVTQIAGSSTAATNAKNFWASVETGTAQSGANGSITLQSNESAVDDFYLNAYITILSGTGVGQTRRITGYTGLSKVATVDTNWATNPSGDSVYQIFGRN